jgi:hypothetical protein
MVNTPQSTAHRTRNTQTLHGRTLTHVCHLVRHQAALTTVVQRAAKHDLECGTWHAKPVHNRTIDTAEDPTAHDRVTPIHENDRRQRQILTTAPTSITDTTRTHVVTGTAR